MKKSYSRILRVILATASIAGCQVSTGRSPADWPGEEKIKFSVENIRPDGLRGTPDGLVAVSYEFCIPADDRVYQQVLSIDPGLQILPGSSGRSGCTNKQSLAIGETGGPHWREVLMALTLLAYVTEIRECFFE